MCVLIHASCSHRWLWDTPHIWIWVFSPEYRRKKASPQKESDSPQTQQIQLHLECHSSIFLTFKYIYKYRNLDQYSNKLYIWSIYGCVSALPVSIPAKRNVVYATVSLFLNSLLPSCVFASAIAIVRLLTATLHYLSLLCSASAADEYNDFHLHSDDSQTIKRLSFCTLYGLLLEKNNQVSALFF